MVSLCRDWLLFRASMSTNETALHKWTQAETRDNIHRRVVCVGMTGAFLIYKLLKRWQGVWKFIDLRLDLSARCRVVAIGFLVRVPAKRQLRSLSCIKNEIFASWTFFIRRSITLDLFAPALLTVKPRANYAVVVYFSPRPFTDRVTQENANNHSRHVSNFVI